MRLYLKHRSPWGCLFIAVGFLFWLHFTATVFTAPIQPKCILWEPRPFTDKPSLFSSLRPHQVVQNPTQHPHLSSRHGYVGLYYTVRHVLNTHETQLVVRSTRRAPVPQPAPTWAQDLMGIQVSNRDCDQMRHHLVGFHSYPFSFTPGDELSCS